MTGNTMTIQVTTAELTIIQNLVIEEYRRLQKLTDHAMSHGSINPSDPHREKIAAFLSRNGLTAGAYSRD